MGAIYILHIKYASRLQRYCYVWIIGRRYFEINNTLPVFDRFVKQIALFLDELLNSFNEFPFAIASSKTNLFRTVYTTRTCSCKYQQQKNNC